MQMITGEHTRKVLPLLTTLFLCVSQLLLSYLNLLSSKEIKANLEFVLTYKTALFRDFEIKKIICLKVAKMGSIIRRKIDQK